MSALNNSPLLGASGSQGYFLQRSVRLRSSASAYFNRTPTVAGNQQRFTWSGWVKRGTITNGYQPLFMGGNTTTDTTLAIIFNNTDTIRICGYNTSFIITNAVYRDPSAWYHIVVAVDTTQATSTNRVLLYVNGVQVTASTYVAPSLNANFLVNTAVLHTQGTQSVSWGFNYFDGYLEEINFIDGQQLTATSFGEFNTLTGVWQPKKYGGTYGTNGFYLNFQDNSGATATTIGKDSSGNGNNWTPNNISVTAGVTYDSMTDVPTLTSVTQSNFAVMNPLKNTATLSNANLTLSNAASSGYYTSYGTMEMTSGKYYWEVAALDDGINAAFSGFGIADPTIALTSIGTSVANTPANNSRGWMQTARSSISVYGNGLYNSGAAVNSTTRATTTGTRIFMVAYDANTGKCWMGYEGTWWTGDPAAGTSQYFTATAPMMPFVVTYNDGSNSNLLRNINFGQRPFSYTPPTGFVALNTYNLPTPTISNGATQMAATLYTGTGSTQNISNAVNGISFQPNLVWMKSRSNVNNNQLQDSVRGATNRVFSNASDAQSTSATSLTSFNSNGFTVDVDANVNGSGVTFVAWQWKESASSGFDIVVQTLATTGINTITHNLGVIPKMVLAKRTNGVEQWLVYQSSVTTQSQYLGLNTTAAVATSANLWGSSAFTSSQIYFNGTSGNAYVFYIFADIAGFSKFGSYTGNGSTDGPFVYLGFRPRWIMYKRTDSTGSWCILDTSRNQYNLNNLYLFADLSNAETAAGGGIDILSNGFKLRINTPESNASGGTYIFAAFAENPFKNSLAR